jgi:hypothetical protein
MVSSNQTTPIARRQTSKTGKPADIKQTFSLRIKERKLPYMLPASRTVLKNVGPGLFNDAKSPSVVIYRGTT